MQSEQTTPPKRIWADPPETFDGMDIWRSEPGGKGVPYILASEVAALIAEAEARGMEQAAKRLDARIESLVADHGSHEWDTNVTNLPEWVETATEELEEQATAIRAEAAAIRRAAEETGT